MDKSCRKKYMKVFSRQACIAQYRLYKLQRGSAAVEYTVVTLIVIGALFVPLNGAGSLSGVGLLLQGLRNFQMHSSFLLSLP